MMTRLIQTGLKRMTIEEFGEQVPIAIDRLAHECINSEISYRESLEKGRPDSLEDSGPNVIACWKIIQAKDDSGDQPKASGESDNPNNEHLMSEEVDCSRDTETRIGFVTCEAIRRFFADCGFLTPEQFLIDLEIENAYGEYGY